MNKRKQMLLESALSLFIQHGYANTTIQMILDHSGVSKGTFYKFFSSKDDCFQAIFEQRMQEDIEIRKSLENDRYASDFDLLVDQIAVPMTLPDKERVWTLFWTGFYSGEINSANLAKMQLSWLSERFARVFGEEIRPYASEGAIICYGMLHQVANVSRSFHTRQPDWQKLVHRVLTYVGVLLRAMQERHEHLFDYQTLSLFQSMEQPGVHERNIAALLEEIEKFNRKVQKSKEPAKVKELVKGLLSLFQAHEELNVTLVEIVLRELQAECESSGFKADGKKIVRDCWWYLEQSKAK